MIIIPDRGNGSGGGGGSGSSLPVVACRVVGLYNIVIATELKPTDTVDGVALAQGDVVLLAYQTDATQNGAYEVQAAGAALRIATLDASAEFVGGLRFIVTAGTFGIDSRWVLRTHAPTLGVTPIVIDEEHTGSPLDYVQHDDWLGNCNESESPLGGAHGWVLFSNASIADNTGLEDSTRGPVRGVMLDDADESATLSPCRPGEGYAFPDDDLIEHHSALVRLDQLSVDDGDLRLSIGLADGLTTFPTLGAWFSYVAEVSANWLAETADGVGATTTDTGIAVTADTWIQLDLWMRGENALFVVDRAFGALITADIPQGAASLVRAQLSAFKGGSGDADEEQFFWAYYAVARRYLIASRT